MYDLLKAHLLGLVVTVSLLLGFTLYPPCLSAGADLKGAAGGSGPAGALLNKNSPPRLIGTAVNMKNPDGNIAVIEEEKDRKQWIYSEGDLVGEMRIIKILPDRIIVTGGSGEEEVKLQRTLIGGVAAGTPATVGKTVLPSLANRAGSRNRNYLVDRQEVAAALIMPNQLRNNIDIRFVNRSNRDRGIRIGSFTPDSIFPAMGLRSGDLITGINDKLITSTDDAVAMLQTMFDRGEGELRVRRRARTYRFHLQTE